MKIIIAVLIFSFIVIFHEFGHYFVAKRCGIRVNEFMLGLGPRLFGFQRGETLFSVHLLPFGGACVMEGEDQDTSDERSFQKKPAWQRFLVVLAGPVFNFLLAYILAVILVACVGYQPAKIEKLMDGYPAAEAGIKAGDQITDINGYHIHFYGEVRAYTMLHSGKPLSVTVERESKGKTVKKTYDIRPRYDKESKVYLLGIQGGTTSVRTNIFGALRYGAYQVRYLIYVTFGSLKMLFTGQLGVTDMSGPVGIVKTIGDAYEQSLAVSVFLAVMEMLNLTVLLSANLGVMNLLPFPALDGGRLVFLLVEMITKKKAPEKLEGAVNFAGFAILMGFMVLVMISDITKLF
ncbi:MAG: M50 family metallopeptidase [Lachnospiraceae bacterium]|nr:M50 family metallopeptidase [Lachnospiraceae bacterium]MDD6451686.1 M50 family metallopeptidase [Lachnospiraceae bacterium]